MISFKKATIEDASDYANILNQSWKDTYGEYITYEHIDDEFNIDKLIKCFGEYIANPDYDLYMISKDGKNIGILELGHYDEQYKNDMSGVGEIRTLHIKKEYHNQGIGSTAFSFAEKELIKSGYTTICLWVKKQNTKAIDMYKRRGYRITSHTCENPSDGAPSMVMEKSIKER